jgi:hypothetical protein
VTVPGAACDARDASPAIGAAEGPSSSRPLDARAEVRRTNTILDRLASRASEARDGHATIQRLENEVHRRTDLGQR